MPNPETVARSSATPQNLPAHSSMGGSVMDRIINCPGSYWLAQLLKGAAGDDPEYRRDGVEAHLLASNCLTRKVDAWMEIGAPEYANLTSEMADAVQVYLDYVRALPGEHSWELQMHRPELHELAFGTLDFAAVPRTMGRVIEFVDYKHGEGVIVNPVKNIQVMYYAYLKLGDDPEFDDAEVVRLTIVQPRGRHPDGAVRSWDTTVGEIRRFAHEELVKTMEGVLARREIYLNMGSHCHFCPAKLICPAMSTVADAANALSTNKEISVAVLSDEDIGSWYERAEVMKFWLKAIGDEALTRLKAGRKVPGLKLVPGIKHRVWKDETPLEEWTHPKAMTPAAVADTGAAGKAFVKKWAFTPTGDPTVAFEKDNRMAISVQPVLERFREGIDRLKTTG